MLFRYTNSILRRVYRGNVSNCRSLVSAASETEITSERITSLFFDKNVQKYLKVLTRSDSARVFRVRRDGRPPVPPRYEFMTDKQLQVAQAKAKKTQEMLLQMPPVVKARDDKINVIFEDPALQGHDTCKYVFTDITYGISNKARIIVVRDQDGTLRHATGVERDRLNQIYFPTKGREIFVPKMFQEPYIMEILEREDYEFILDRACIQFEPDDPEYQKITHMVYSYVNSMKHFEHLRSTRHFGPFVYFLVCEENIDQLLLNVINGGYINEAVLLIKLFHKVHNGAASANKECKGEEDTQFIRYYIELDSVKRGALEKSLQAYEILLKEKKEHEQNVKKAHGVIPVTEKLQVESEADRVDLSEENQLTEKENVTVDEKSVEVDSLDSPTNEQKP
ncbi:hypothetical protein KM043_012975 [Ampulex compressa]|nr:hypothetical protein KM043_012975 [Ampulex compressa]